MVPSLVQTLFGGQVKWQLSEHDPVSDCWDLPEMLKGFPA